MDLLTIDRVKNRLNTTDSDHDTFLAALVSRVSALAEKQMNRHAERKARTEYLRVAPGQRVFVLQGYPVDATPFTLHNDSTREFPASSLLDADQYALDDLSGIVEVDLATLEDGPRAMKVTYTGGMALNVTAFGDSFPDIADALAEEVVRLFKRRDDPGLTSVSAEGGSVSIASDQPLLPSTVAILDGYKRYHLGSG